MLNIEKIAKIDSIITKMRDKYDLAINLSISIWRHQTGCDYTQYQLWADNNTMISSKNIDKILDALPDLDNKLAADEKLKNLTRGE